jgi:shikimate kinase
VTELLKGLNIFLVGMMGAGKTTVGKELASKIGYRFIDTDVLIETVANQTINEIFADSGEEGFRQLESQVLSEISAYTRLSVATGGGIVTQRHNWSYLHHGLVVWLDVPIEVLSERLASDTTRPLLQQANPTLALQNILDKRRNLYAEADLHISVKADETAEEIASRVIAEIPTVLKEFNKKN